MTDSTGLIQQSAGGQLAAADAYSNIDATLQFINAIGPVLWKSGAGGVKTDAEGKLMALACLTERKNPFEINRTYHLMDGKLSMRADAMLAELRSRGGTFRWIKTGDDEQEAVIHLEFAGNAIDSRYTIEQARKAGLIKPKGGWEKNPANMLRARAISEGVRMIAPEIIAGTYTPEEIEDINNAPKPARTNAEVADRGEQLRQMQQEATQQAAPSPSQDDEIIDAVVETKRPPEPERKPVPEPKKPAATETASPAETATASATASATAEPVKDDVPFDVPDPKEERAKAEAAGKLPDRWIIDMELDVVLQRLGKTREAFDRDLQNQSNGAIKSFEDLPDDKAYRVLQNVEAKANAS